MTGAHVAHDCLLHEGVTLSAGVVLGGHVEIQPYANLGMNACVHQRVKIGAASMVGAGSTVLYDVRCGSKVVGSPARWIGSNRIGMERFHEQRLPGGIVPWMTAMAERPGRLRESQ